MSAAGLNIAPAEAAAFGLAGVGTRMRSGLARYVAARSRAVAIRQLERMSDATLADLGIARGRIRELVRDRELPWS